MMKQKLLNLQMMDIQQKIDQKQKTEAMVFRNPEKW